MNVHQVVSVVYNKVVQLLSTAPKGALSVTGILGLALLVYGYLQFRGNDNRAEEQRREHQRAHLRAAAGSTATAAQQSLDVAGAPAAKPQSGCASSTPVGRAVSVQLSGVKRVTLSLPGVVFAERTPSELQESATVRPEVVEVLREMSRVSDVYLIAHVEDDVGEAVVTGALEAAGVLGNGPGQIRQHHLLCCSTLDGKVPIVRQLEPELHVDGHSGSIDDLKRFMPHLLLVREGHTSAASGQANVGIAASLPSYFGL